MNFSDNDKILYLGDSENDIPAFEKADISIGIKSYKRINTPLSCQYYIDYKDLHLFLKGLLKNDFVFSEDLFKF